MCFSEDTDMNKLKKELIEIYGPGKAEAYRYSLYDNNTDRNGRFGRRISSLEAAAENEIYQNVVEGNPFQDALEDPEYMTHHWVTENGLSIIPEEVVEYFRSAEDEQMPQDEDAFMEKLDQMPWVVISMANRHPAAIINEIKGTEYEWEELQTNNCMTFSADLLAEYLYTAQTANLVDNTVATDPTDDTTAAVTPPTEEAFLLEFPDIPWDSTPEEVRQLLNLTDAQIVLDEKIEADPKREESNESWKLYVTDVTFFGQKVKFGLFNFVRYPWVEDFALTSIQLYYPDDADMTIVQNALTQTYGSSKDGLGFTRCKISQGAAEIYTDSGTKLYNYEGQESQMIHWWESTAKRADVYPENVQEAMITSFANPESITHAEREVVLEWLEKDPAVLLYCTDSSRSGAIGYYYYTKNVVFFDASDYTHQIQYYGK